MKFELFQGDCLSVMQEIPTASVDMILCDLPYGTTRCKWDTVIPFGPLWEQYKRIIKDTGAIALFGSEPFATELRYSNLKMYKYDWYWEKAKPVGFANAKRMPMKNIETISVFCKKSPIYNPQGLIKVNKIVKNSTGKTRKGMHMSGQNGGAFKEKEYVQEYENYPRQLLRFPHVSKPVHETQKPVSLLEYLIKTYTHEGGTVLDNCMGSGSTGVACVNTDRNFIGIELDPRHFAVASERIKRRHAEKQEEAIPCERQM